MGRRSARRRKAKIKAYMAEHNISKHTTAARAVNGQHELDTAQRHVLGDIQRGGVEKTSVDVSIPLSDTVRVVDLTAPPRTVDLLSSAWKGGQLKPKKIYPPVGFLELARQLANGDPIKLVDSDTTDSGIASLVITWLIHCAQSDDSARITDWLAQRHGRVLTAAQHAVLDGLLGDPDLRLDLGQPDSDDDPASYLGLLDGVLDMSRLPNLAVWSGADHTTSWRVVRLLERWEDEYGPLVVDRASATTSLPHQGNLTFRRVAAILISWVIEVARSDDPQRITACLPQFDLALTAEQQATLAELVADPTLRVARDARRTVLFPEAYLWLLGAVLSAPHQVHGPQ